MHVNGRALVEVVKQLQHHALDEEASEPPLRHRGVPERTSVSLSQKCIELSVKVVSLFPLAGEPHAQHRSKKYKQL